ncbi:hypothetical protein [Jannaschia sp. 2305UL9-9]|uniref:hypothetical protein n=1 Tax=Jannaschia sp. 2305UL9-9 TaxID=3121638 RepID=UPI003527B279
MYSPFSRVALFLVAICGWAVLFFGGWIAVRGLFFYSGDPVLMGTGGGLAVGGLLVVALTVGAGAQVSTARDTFAMRQMMEAEAKRAAGRPTSPVARTGMAPPPPVAATPQDAKAKPALRADPPIGRAKS